MRLIALLFSLFLSVCPLLPDNNMNSLVDLGLDARVVSEEEKKSLVEGFQIQITKEQQTTELIHSFAIETEESKYIYLAFEDNCIDVYSIQEHYEYSIRLKNYGIYQIFCSDGMFYLYIVRGSWVFSFDQNGNVAEVYELNGDNSVSNDEVLDRLCNRTKYVVEGKTFEIGCNSPIINPFFAPYSYLKVTDQDGVSHYLYQTSDSPHLASIIFALFLLASALIMLQKEKEKNNDNDQKKNRT